MRTSLTVMLQLLKFGHMITSTTKFERGDKFFGDVKERNCDVITLFSK